MCTVRVVWLVRWNSGHGGAGLRVRRGTGGRGTRSRDRGICDVRGFRRASLLALALVLDACTCARIWSRMFLRERDPKWLIEQGYLEAMQDFEDNGETIPGSRLGYRITFKFVDTFFGRMFTEPRSVFTDEMLRPELQNFQVFLL